MTETAAFVLRSLGQRLFDARVATGLTVRAAAHAIGVDHSMVDLGQDHVVALVGVAASQGTVVGHDDIGMPASLQRFRQLVLPFKRADDKGRSVGANVAGYVLEPGVTPAACSGAEGAAQRALGPVAANHLDDARRATNGWLLDPCGKSASVFSSSSEGSSRRAVWSVSASAACSIAA